MAIKRADVGGKVQARNIASQRLVTGTNLERHPHVPFGQVRPTREVPVEISAVHEDLEA